MLFAECSLACLFLCHLSIWCVIADLSLSLIDLKNIHLLSVLRQTTRYAFAYARSFKSSRVVFVLDRGRRRAYSCLLHELQNGSVAVH